MNYWYLPSHHILIRSSNSSNTQVLGRLVTWFSYSSLLGLSHLRKLWARPSKPFDSHQHVLWNRLLGNLLSEPNFHQERTSDISWYTHTRPSCWFNSIIMINKHRVSDWLHSHNPQRNKNELQPGLSFSDSEEISVTDEVKVKISNCKAKTASTRRKWTMNSPWKGQEMLQEYPTSPCHVETQLLKPCHKESNLHYTYSFLNRGMAKATIANKWIITVMISINMSW